MSIRSPTHYATLQSAANNSHARTKIACIENIASLCLYASKSIYSQSVPSGKKTAYSMIRCLLCYYEQVLEPLLLADCSSTATMCVRTAYTSCKVA